MPSAAHLTRLEIEQLLLGNMEQARREYREACMAEQGFVVRGLSSQDGWMPAPVAQGSRRREAFECYRAALKAFNDFIMDGKVPG